MAVLAVFVVIYAIIIFENGKSRPESPVAGQTTTSTPSATFLDPSFGAPNATATIIEFGDYACASCKAAESTVAEVLARHGNVRLVWKDFPLENLNAEAVRAAEAAHCAQDQGKFWEFHDRLFAENRPLSGLIYAEIAGGLELDRSTFDACMATRKKEPLVRSNLEAGLSAGVTAIPAFFINGVRLTDDSATGFDRALSGL